MNQQERDALRELHQRHDSFGERYCLYCKQDWPCDAMKRLIAEQTPDSEHPELKIPSECDHWVGTVGDDQLLYSDWQHEPQMWEFAYCPKCGEKL